MARTVTEYKVLIASPGDLDAARVVAHDTILKWNELHTTQRQVVLTPLMWETHSTPEMGGRPQAIINQQLVDSCDVVIGMFWTRLGTPTGEARSGTVEEIERLIKANKRASIFFCTATVNPYGFDQDEFKRVEEYLSECETRGLLAVFERHEELRDQLLRTLTHHVDELETSRGGEGALGAGPQETLEASGTTRFPIKISAPTAEGDSKEGNWFSLARRGEYKEAMSAFAEASNRKEVKDESGDSKHFAQLVAFEDGGAWQAFLDLEQAAKDSTENFPAWFWYAVALEHAERHEDAIAAMRHVADNEGGKLGRFATNWLATTLCEIGRMKEGLDVWRSALASEKSPRVRAMYLSRIARSYERIEGMKDQAMAQAFDEYALETFPGDIDTRLNVAYRYGVDLGAGSLGLFHYLETLGREENNPTALVNAGWSADKLSLPITAVRHYQDGQKAGEALAATNLGWKLLEAGFADEAEKMVAAARELGGDQSLADKLAVAIREKRDDESARWKTTQEKITKVRQTRVKFAKALLLTGPPAESISGAYVGSHSGLQLISDANGYVSGSLNLPGGRAATFAGKLEGKALSFNWVSPHTGKLATTLLTDTTIVGHGRFVLTENGLQGYTAPGSETVDPLELDTVLDWDLRRASA